MIDASFTMSDLHGSLIGGGTVYDFGFGFSGSLGSSDFDFCGLGCNMTCSNFSFRLGFFSGLSFRPGFSSSSSLGLGSGLRFGLCFQSGLCFSGSAVATASVSAFACAAAFTLASAATNSFSIALSSSPPRGVGAGFGCLRFCFSFGLCGCHIRFSLSLGNTCRCFLGLECCL
jgi:hypothetical protein